MIWSYFRKGEDLLVADPLPLEDAALGDGVVHHLALPRGIAHKVGIGFGLGLRPFVSPYGGSVAVDGVDLGDLHAGYLGDVLQHHVLGKAASTDASEVCRVPVGPVPGHTSLPGVPGLDPVGSLPDTFFIVAHLVVEVVDDDVVWALLLLLESTGRLGVYGRQRSLPGTCGACIWPNFAARRSGPAMDLPTAAHHEVDGDEDGGMRPAAKYGRGRLRAPAKFAWYP